MSDLEIIEQLTAPFYRQGPNPDAPTIFNLLFPYANIDLLEIIE